MNPELHMHAQVSAWIKMKKEKGRKKKHLAGLNSSHHMSYTWEKEKGENKELTGSNLRIHKFLHKRTQIYTAKL